MKDIIVFFALVTVAFALPQAPPLVVSATESASKSYTTDPTPTSPKTIGQLPKDGLNGVPGPDFGVLASQLGFDPAKATPDPSG
jgi:hypothetical protein